MKLLFLLSLGLYSPVFATVEISNLLQNISESYFSTSRCIAFISDKNSSVNFDFVQGKVPVSFVDLSSNSSQSENLLQAPLEAGCSGFILSVGNLSAVMTLLLNAARNTVLRQNRKYIVVENSTSIDPSSILSLPQLRFTPDFVLLLAGENKSVSLWTHAFVGENIEEQNLPLLLEEWVDGEFKYGTNLFPDKLNNFKGRKLSFATFHYPPYAIIDKGVFDGTEVRLGIELAQQLNFSWSIVTDDSQWGEIFDNATGNGILGTVAEDRADFGFGALYLWYHEYQFLDFSVPYIRTGITCLAPRPLLLSGLRAPTLPFSAHLWMAVGVSLAVAATSICVFANLQSSLYQVVHGGPPSSEVRALCRPLNCVLLVVGMSVLAAGPSLPRGAAALKHTLTWFLVQCLLLATCYASSLVSFMTVPRFAEPVDSAADVANANLHWAATHDAWAFSLREASDPVHSKVYQLFLEMKESELHSAAVSERSKIAFSIERLPAGNFAVGDYLYHEEALSRLRLMKEDLYWEMVVTVVRKGSPYLEILNNLILRLSHSGILLFWEGEVARKFLSSRHQLAIRNSHGSAGEVGGPTILAVRHIQGVFVILAIGLAIAALVFLREISCSGKLQRKSRETFPKIIHVRRAF